MSSSTVKNAVRVLTVIVLVAVMATVAVADSAINLDDYDTQGLVSEVFSTWYAQILPQYKVTYVSGDVLYQSIGLYDKLVRVGEKHDFRLDSDVNQKITAGEYTGKDLGASWYLAIKLETTSRDMAEVTDLSELGIQWNFNVYDDSIGHQFIEGTRMTLTTPIVIRDNWEVRPVKFLGNYTIPYYAVDQAYSYGKEVPAGTVVTIKATGQPGARVTATYEELEKYGTFTGNMYGAWREYQSNRKIIVSGDYKALETTYHKDGPSTGSTRLIDGKADVIEMATLENRDATVKTAQGLLDLGMSTGWWAKGQIVDLGDGFKEVVVNLSTPKFRLSENMQYNETPSVYLLPSGSWDDLLENVIEIDGWLETTNNKNLGYVSIIVDENDYSSAADPEEEESEDEESENTTLPEDNEAQNGQPTNEKPENSLDTEVNETWETGSNDHSAELLANDLGTANQGGSGGGGGCNTGSYGLMALTIVVARMRRFW